MDARDYYSSNAAAYDRENGEEDVVEPFRVERTRFLDALEGERVLDAGCGPGRDVHHFTGKGLDAYGVDVAEGMVERARATRDGGYVQGSIDALPFAEDAFDGVWCSAAIFLLDPDGMQDALEEYGRVLRDGGTLSVGFKLGEGVYGKEAFGDTVDQYFVAREEAEAMLDGAGFAVENVATADIGPDRVFAQYLCTR